MTKIALKFEMSDLSSLISEVSSDIQFKAYAISCRYLEVEHLPRVDDLIMFPIFSLLPESFRYWMHTRIAFRVAQVIHNPIAVVPFSFSDNPPDERSPEEFNTIVVVQPVLAEVYRK